ncbi:MAG: hypothetical protein Q9227_007135 [Pyrenula ochraceoflavens]
MDSRKIADELEKRHPSPPLHLDSPLLPEVLAILPKAIAPMVPVIMPLVPRVLLSPTSAEYFERTRAVRFGMPLEELEKSEKGGETAWKAASPHLTELGHVLKRNLDGPFVMGTTRPARSMPVAEFRLISVWPAAPELPQS